MPSLGDQPPRQRLHPGPGRLTAEDAGRQDLPGQDAAHPGGRCSARDVATDCDAVEVEVIDDADGLARVVDELAVQQVQPGVESAGQRGSGASGKSLSECVIGPLR